LFVLSCSLFAQTTVSGTVVDATTKETLIGVTVQLKSTPNTGTTTDINGRYQIVATAPQDTLVFRYTGYNNATRIVKIEEQAAQTLNVALSLTSLTATTIIVTDGKYEKKLEESTVSVDVINQQQLENNNLTSLDEIVKKTSGVQIMDGQISIRGGAGYAYGVGSRVIFLVDGQPLLSAELSDIKWNFMPLENAAQIEIIKGSASVLYGSGALNGVINLRTAYPKGDSAYTAFSLYAGVFDQPRIDSMRWYNPATDGLTAQPHFSGIYFAHRERLHPNVDLVLGGNIHLQNGYFKGADERRFRFNFSTRIRAPKSDGRISYGLNGNIMYHENGLFFMAKNMSDNAYENLTEINRDRYYSLTLDPYVTLFDRAENKHDVRGRWFRISKVQKEEDSDADIGSLEYQFQRTFPKDWLLTAGAMGQYFHVNSILFADLDADNSERELFTAGSGAVYAQLDKKFFERLSATVGLRWEGFVFDTSVVSTLPIFRAGLNFEASPNDFIRASYGQGFRLPSMGERYFNERIPGTFVGIYPNPDLQAETGWSAELAYRRLFGGKRFKLYLDVAFFLMEYDNMVEFALGSFPQGPGFSFINVSKARIGGWEISTQGEVRIGKVPLRLWGGYTYSFPGDLSSDTSRLRNYGAFAAAAFSTFTKRIEREQYPDILKYRRLHTLRFDAETEWKGITLGTAINYNSYMHHIDLLFEFDLISAGVDKFRSIHNQGYWVWDWRLGYAFNSKQRLNLVVQNVLNEEYAVRPAQMGAPRSFSLKYSHVF
jgi:iron complex outermembrane receptor protein